MEREAENLDAPQNAKDQADRLAQLLWRRNAHARDLIHGSNANILKVACERIEALEAELDDIRHQLKINDLQ